MFKQPLGGHPNPPFVREGCKTHALHRIIQLRVNVETSKDISVIFNDSGKNLNLPFYSVTTYLCFLLLKKHTQFLHYSCIMDHC